MKWMILPYSRDFENLYKIRGPFLLLQRKDLQIPDQPNQIWFCHKIKKNLILMSTIVDKRVIYRSLWDFHEREFTHYCKIQTKRKPAGKNFAHKMSLGKIIGTHEMTDEDFKKQQSMKNPWVIVDE